MSYIDYKSGDINESCLVTIKIDGVQARKDSEGNIVSRHGKPLYNIPDFEGTVEVYLGSFKETVSSVRTKIKMIPIKKEHLYQLTPTIDERLILAKYDLLTEAEIRRLFLKVFDDGHEGLVIHTKDKMYKVKNRVTFDVIVQDVIAGKGKHTGRLGALVTEIGNIGTGFTDIEREQFTKEYIVGKMVEIEAMELLSSGKVRHPRFLRLREDK